MAYEGVIKKSRTVDLAAVGLMIDAASLAFLAYTPEQLGVTVPAYMGIRVVFAILAIYLRAKTTGPMGEKLERTEAT